MTIFKQYHYKILFMKIYCALLLLSIIFSCKSNNTNFAKDIPPTLLTDKGFYESQKPFMDSLNLDDLENGFDSLEIRIWIIPPLSIRQQVVIIKNKAGHWSSSLITYKAHYLNRKMDSVSYYEKNITFAEPNISWKDFTEKLFDLNIMTLPDQRMIKGYEYPFDGIDLEIEIATKHVYRLYTYHEPSLNKKFEEARNIIEIVNTISKDLNYKFLIVI